MANYNLHLLKCSKDPLKAVLSLWFTVLALFADRAVNGYVFLFLFVVFCGFWFFGVFFEVPFNFR